MRKVDLAGFATALEEIGVGVTVLISAVTLFATFNGEAEADGVLTDTEVVWTGVTAAGVVFTLLEMGMLWVGVDTVLIVTGAEVVIIGVVMVFPADFLLPLQLVESTT